MSAPKKKNEEYSENVFLIQLPAIIFLVFCSVIASIVCLLPLKPKSYSPNDMILIASPQSATDQAKESSGGASPSQGGGAAEHEGLILMKGSDCLACHKETENLVGPSFANIAFRYKKDANALSYLSDKVLKGSTGSWGAMPMPPHPAMSEADAKKMVQYVMTIKGGVDVPKPAAPSTEAQPVASASEVSKGLTLIKGSDCTACHKDTEDLVGPSYLKVAEKYKGDANAMKHLSEKIIKGGAGVWGQIPMLPHASLSEADANEMVRYILSVGGGATASVQPSAGASEVSKGLSLIKGSDCTACHKDTEDLVGPSYLKVAEKYKGDANAMKHLSEKIIKGGAGVWGQIPMLPHASLSEADANEMVRYVLSVGSGAAVQTAVVENPGAALFKKNDCLVCHEVDKELIGPSYQDIAKRYKNDANALKALIEKVKAGGKGNWGEAPMIPHKKMSDEDLELIIKWVLSQ